MGKQRDDPGLTGADGETASEEHTLQVRKDSHCVPGPTPNYNIHKG